jgi:hypothetical protein
VVRRRAHEGAMQTVSDYTVARTPHETGSDGVRQALELVSVRNCYEMSHKSMHLKVSRKSGNESLFSVKGRNSLY